MYESQRASQTRATINNPTVSKIRVGSNNSTEYPTSQNRSPSLNRRALGRVQRIRKRERIEVESRIDQGEDRHSDHNQGGLEKNRVNLTRGKARVEKEQQERENRDTRSDEGHDTADV